MTPNETARTLYNALDKKLAGDLKLLKVGELTVLADFFILATANSSTHIRALCDECEHVMKEHGILPHHIEGYHSGNWILLDFGAVIVHVFLKETRAFYSIERLWADAEICESDDL